MSKEKTPDSLPRLKSGDSLGLTNEGDVFIGALLALCIIIAVVAVFFGIIIGWILRG